MRYGILGQLEVLDNVDGVPLAQGRQRLLLAVLLVHANEPVSKESLIDALWGEAPPPTAARSLHNHVSALRKALGDGQLVTEARGYRLVVADGALDADRFETLVEGGRAALEDETPQRAADLLREGLALWRGPAFGDLAHETAIAAHAGSLDERRLSALEDRIDADLVLGSSGELVGELDGLVAEHPLRERLRGQQMLALYRSGRQADALAAFAAARRYLVDELGIEPGPALRDLEQAILDQDPALGAPRKLPPPPRPDPLARARRHPWRLAAAGAALVLAALAGAVLLGAGDDSKAGSTANAGDAVAVVDPHTGRVVAEVPVGGTPTSIAVGAGAVWVLNADDQTIAQIDPKTKRVGTPFAVGATPTDLAADAGTLWVGLGGGEDEVGAATSRLVGLDGERDTVRAPVDLPPTTHEGATGLPGQMAVGKGALWVIDGGEDLSRIDPRSGRVTAVVRSLRARAVAPDGNSVWTLADGDTTIARVDAAAATVRRRFSIPAARLDAIAAGFGFVWAVDAYSGTLWRIDPGRKIVARGIQVGEGVDGVTVGAGAVWVINSLRGTLTRIDPQGNRAAVTIPVGNTPRDLDVGAGAVWVSLAGGPEHVPAATEAVGGPALPDTACRPVLAGGGAPQFLIASDMPLHGPVLQFGAASSASAAAFVVRRHGFRAGRFRVGYQSCDDATATARWDPAKCAANAKAYAATPALLGVISPWNSGCANVEIPILDRAPGGPVAMISPSNSDLGLTQRDPFAPRDALRHLYPTGVRNYARVIPSADGEAAADAELARRLGLRRVVVLDDGSPIGTGLAKEFGNAAGSLGLPIADAARWNPSGAGFGALADRVRRARADGVFLAGTVGASAGPLTATLRRRLGPDVVLIAANPILPVGFLWDTSHGAARGMYISSPWVPVERLGDRGRRFVREFSATHPGQPVGAYAVYAAAATEALLDAIARSDGTRASVTHQLLQTDEPDSLLGPLRFDRNGDLTDPRVAIMRVLRRDGASSVEGYEGSVVDRVIDVRRPTG